MAARSERQFCAEFGGKRLVFKVIALSQIPCVGITRTCYSETGITAQSLVFDNRQDFTRWLAEDEFRLQAPKLFVDVSRAFDLTFSHDQNIGP